VFGWLKKIRGNAKTTRAGNPQRVVRVVRARYDAAVTNDSNFRHWVNADGLSINAAAMPGVRRLLRNRSRYEVYNNSYARGIVSTLANDIVGTGPRLQMLTGNPQANGQIERAFSTWADAVNLAEKLRTIRLAQIQDGEGFAILINNPKLDNPVTLDLKLVEADQISSPYLIFPQKDRIDGIIFDEHGNPRIYDVLREHPGNVMVPFTAEFDKVPAASVIHLFRADRPGQMRGLPEIMPALPLFAQLRRFTLAVLGAAETAADFAGILYTDAPANGEAEPVEPMDTIELESRALLTMPGGWKMGQVHAEQPSTTYAEFKKEILNEIARCLNMPFNVAAGNSSGYNYASGRLDHQTYFKSIRVDRSRIELVALDRIFHAWLDEAQLVEGLLPQSARRVNADFTHQWFWDGQEHVDPAKEAQAQQLRLANNTTTLASEFAKQGRDWEVEIRQRAKEVALMVQLGLTPTPVTPLATTIPTGQTAETPDPEADYATPDTDD
jgi:lambda family phage portal protein